MPQTLASVLSLLVLALASPAWAQDKLWQQTCSADQSATIQSGADAWIGGIISLNNAGSEGYGCGDPSGSMQSYEAIRWVLDLLNKKDETINTEYVDDYYVPGIRLGVKIKNYCMNELSALAAIADVYPEIGGDADVCSEPFNNLTLGIIGATTSDDTMAVSEAVASFTVPVVSYEATAMQLTMAGMYTNFMRTISPDGPLMDVIVAVLSKLQWHHLVIVYDSGTYGTTAYSELHARLVAAGICLSSTVVVNDEDLSTAGSTVERVISAGVDIDPTADDLTGVIFFGSSSYAQALISAGDSRLAQDSGKLQWLFLDFPITTTFEASSKYQHGIITITPGSRYITEFEDHWIRIDENNPSAENPWFQEWFEYNYNCRFSPAAGDTDCGTIFPGINEEDREQVKRAEFEQDPNVEAAVMAVFTYARALRTAQMARCGAVKGVCAALASMTREEFYEDYLKKVDFTFTSTERVPSLASNNVLPYNSAKKLAFTEEGDIEDPSYFIYNYNDLANDGTTGFRFRNVGSYVNSYLDLNLDNVAIYDEDRDVRVYPAPTSSCSLFECSPCLGLPADIKYYYQPGDIVINGIFSLHQTGGSPLTCGDALSPNQYEYLEAMIYAIEKVNSDPNILPNIRLGGLGLDDCSSSVLGQAFLAQIQRGNLVIRDDDGNNELDPLTIEAYTAAHTSPLTLPLAEAMNELMRPMVGYRATSSELNDATRFPYFLQAVPSIGDEIEAIILLLKKLEWYYVQVIVSSDYYSMDAEMIFRDLGAKAGICITARHDMGNSSVEDVLMGVTLNPSTQPVVVLLDSPGYRQLLEGLASDQGIQIGTNYALIATTRLGRNEEVVNGYEDEADQFISLSYQHSTLATFKTYLEGLTANAHPTNPWFNDWYEAVFECVLGGADTPCDTSKNVAEGQEFELLYEVDSVINSVYAIARGLDATLTQFCGNGYTSVCTQFLTASNKGSSFVEQIRGVSFNVEDTFPTLVFSFEGRSAAIPFEINRLDYDTQAQTLEFTKVGDVNPFTNVLSLLSSGRIPLEGTHPTCPPPCLSCLYTFNYLNYWYTPGDLVIAGIFDAHYKGDGPYDCGDFRASNGALYTEVFNFALQQVNSGTASVGLNGVTLGGLVFDGCSNPSRATAILNRVQTGMEITSESGEMLETSDLISWLSYDSQTTIDVANLLRSLGLPIVSPGATARELDDKSEFTTFFRTIPSDSVVVQGMAEFVRDMGWQYVISLNAPDVASRQDRDYFRELLAGFGICVVASYEFETDGSMNVIYGSISDADTQVVAVFADPDQYIEDFLEEVSLHSDTLIFVANRPWKVTNYGTQVERSIAFTLEPENPVISDFVDYLNLRAPLMTNNPWFDATFEALFECNLPGTFTYTTDCNAGNLISSQFSWEENIWTLSTINAIYALTDGIHRTLQDECGQNYNGLCDNFSFASNLHEVIMNNMDQAAFTDIATLAFNFVNREANRGYLVQQYISGSRITMGSLSREGALTLTDADSLMQDYINRNIQSECGSDCSQCDVTGDNLEEFSFIRGDVYIIGLFDVHKNGSTPFTCGEINEKHGLPLLEAFNYAIEYVNANEGIFRGKLQGVQIGGIALDTCMSPSRAANLVANIHSGTLDLGIGSADKTIEAYIGPMDTESTLRTAAITTPLAVPQISYGATGVQLLDTEQYSYFLRSVPADDKQARAIVSYLKKFQFNNIQVVSSFDEIGEPGKEEFLKLAEANKICVKEEHMAGEMGDVRDDVQTVVGQLLLHPEARVVVLWMKDPIPILEAASSDATLSTDYMFIVTDKWGADPDVLLNDNLRTLLTNHKLLILDVETADIPSFDEYLETKTPDNYDRNPWFKEFFEDFQSCVWDGPAATGEQLCDKSSTIPRADHYIQDPYVLYVINAVFSAADAIDKAIVSLCTVNDVYAGGVCDLYFNSGERRQEIMEGLKAVNFTDDTHQPFFYMEDGQSDRGFHIYNVTGTDPNFMYENVGSYNDTDFLKLDITYEPSVVATCDVDGTDPALVDCVCEFPADLPSRHMLKEDGGRGLTLVYIGDIHESHPDNSLACGDINVGPDLQKLLAFFYAIERINTNSDFQFRDSIKFDGLALDSCTNGLRLGQDVYNVLSGNPLCDSDTTSALVSPQSITAFIVDKDHNALPISSMLNQQRITTISPTAGLTQLQESYSYPYFLTTRGDYSQTARAILATANEVGWDYITTIYSDTMQHRSARDALLSQSRDSGVCVGDAVILPMGLTLDTAKQALEDLSQQVSAQGVALFVTPEDLVLLLRASEELGLAGRFSWLIAADYAQDDDALSGLEAEYAGALRYETRSAILEDFNNYVASLTFTNRLGIPDDWFESIYQTIHQCNILDQSETSNTRQYSTSCTEDETISPDSELLPQDPGVLHTIIAVYSAAFGLDQIAETVDGCSSNLDLTACLQELEDRRGNTIRDNIIDVEFDVLPDLLGDESFQFSFDEAGTGRVGLVILNYQASSGDSSYVSTQLGTYQDGELNLNTSAYAARNLYTRGTWAASSCTPGTECTCQLTNGRTWIYAPSSITMDSSLIVEGGTYTHPDTGELIYIRKIPNTTDRFSDTWAIIVTIVACVGAAVSLLLFVYLLVMYPVRGGTSILGFMLSFGIVLLYLTALAFIAHADRRICGLRRFLLGVVYAFVYSSLLVKLVDCWRVRGKDESLPPKYSKLGRPLGLFLVTIFLVLVQAMINAEWVILKEPSMVRIFYRDQYWPVCTPEDFYDEGLVLSCCYVMVIIAVSIIMALLSFSQTKNHRESRWILGILILSVPCWVIWCTVSVLGSIRVRDAAVAIGLIVNATVMLLLVPVRKLYLLHKYNVLLEEEEEDEDESRSAISAAQRGDYNSVYGRQYDNRAHLHDSGSMHDSGSQYGSPRY